MSSFRKLIMLSMHPLKIMQKNISWYRKNGHDTILWKKQVHTIMYDPFLRGKILYLQKQD